MKLTDGGFVVFALTKGTYVINAQKQGYQLGSANVYVDQNMTLVLILSSSVWGYSVSMRGSSATTPASFYLGMAMILSTLFAAIRRKAREK